MSSRQNLQSVLPPLFIGGTHALTILQTYPPCGLHIGKGYVFRNPTKLMDKL